MLEVAPLIYLAATGSALTFSPAGLCILQWCFSPILDVCVILSLVIPSCDRCFVSFRDCPFLLCFVTLEAFGSLFSFVHLDVLTLSAPCVSLSLCDDRHR
ncbi:hypothetical protein PDE_07374 [Penicillium oxalicum 114-2]|uniref:Uncharacterized protein n=1 Tax=Penicillium oxalicum (strain 114-2 / CGMCC 5302) TaxID=933388 RepID=S7ZPV1_PENO1|nr:hypothetical protein PDE_07374 [Penicillium oxalicum 114-2]